MKPVTLAAGGMSYVPGLYMSVCVCVCVCAGGQAGWARGQHVKHTL